MDTESLKELRTKLASALRAGPAQGAVISYDHESDELLILFSARLAERPGVSHRAAENIWVRHDRETGEMLGLQIQHFISLIAPQFPGIMIVLDLAELSGITF